MTIRKCLKHDASCSVVRESLMGGIACPCEECRAYRDELLDQYEAERGTWERLVEELQADCKRLVSHCARIGLALTFGPHRRDAASESWRALPPHLQVSVETEEGRLAKEEEKQ